MAVYTCINSSLYISDIATDHLPIGFFDSLPKLQFLHIMFPPAGAFGPHYGELILPSGIQELSHLREIMITGGQFTLLTNDSLNPLRMLNITSLSFVQTSLLNLTVYPGAFDRLPYLEIIKRRNIGIR